MKHLYSFCLTALLSALSLTAQASKATIYIDKPADVDFFVKTAEGWAQQTLENAGEKANVIEFAEASCDFQFAPIDLLRGINTITKNGEDAKKFTGEGYLVEGVKDGDVIRVTVETPVSDCTVSFAAGLEAIAKVVVNSTETAVSEGKIVVKTFDQVLLYPNADYVIKKVDVDGKEISYVTASGCYAFNVTKDNTVVTITAEKKQEVTKSVTLNIDNAAAALVYVGKSAYSQGAATTDTQLSISSEMPFVQIAPAAGYKILTAKYTDSNNVTADMTFASFEGYYYVNVIEKDVVSISVTTEKEAADMINAIIWVDDVSLLKEYFIRTKDRKFPFDTDGGPYLVNGEQTMTIKTEQSPIRLYLEFKGKPVDELYLNDTKLTGADIDTSDNSLTIDFAIADGDVLKIYTDPEHVTAISSAAVTEKVQRGAYTIQGVTVKGANLTPGLYIIDGKKVMVK